VNALSAAKGRLAEHLEQRGRRDLTAWMLERVLRACAGAGFVDGVLIMAGDPPSARLGASLGASVGGARNAFPNAALHAPLWGERAAAVVGDQDADRPVRAVVQQGRGLPDALSQADVLTAPAAATLVVAADLPLATAGDLQAVWDAAEALAPAGPVVVVAATRDGGTGVLLRRPPDAIVSAYGEGSAARHLDLARRRGVPAVALDVPGLALDVDTAEALRTAADLKPELAPWAALLRGR
jgi:2-phospho-L-lactate guanylyltransferase